MTSRRLLPILLLAFSVLVFAEESRMVYVTPKGAKYHLADCRTLKKSKDVSAITIEEAKAQGYEPCKVCKPGE